MFPMPRIIEYLLALERPEGEKVAWAGIWQMIIPAVPPGVLLDLEATPPNGVDTQITFGAALGNNMVPDVFSLTYQEWGFKRFSCIASQWLIGHIMPDFVATSSGHPSLLTVRNNSPVAQYYEGIHATINIPSAEDYKFIREELKRLGSSARSEQLAQEANLLLREMAGGRPVPRPPMT